MKNEILWLIFALINFTLLIGVYKIFGKTGVFAWIVLGTILANIQVTKNIELFGLSATLGNIMYGTIFLGTDILSEKYGAKDARKGVLIGFFTMISTLVIMQFALLFDPSSSDISQSSLETIFGFLPRIVLGSIIAYLVSQFVDVYLFSYIKKKLPANKYLYIRNNVATILSQLLDTAIFVPIAFLGVYDMKVFWGIFITTYVIKVFVALLDTPFLYLVKLIKPLDEKEGNNHQNDAKNC